jgi:hypothetical protein
VVEFWEVCIALLFVGIDSEDWLDLVATWGVRVERDPTFCELHNRDIGNLCGWPNFMNKSCISLCLLQFTIRFILVFFVFLS